MIVDAQKIVKGRVTDLQTGESLPGASILASGNKTPALTNDKGEFEMKLSAPESVLTISYVGYETLQYQVGQTDKFVQIEMNTGNVSLNTVTVTGYENNRRLLEIAGSISLLSGRDLHRGDNMDIMAAMNNVAGVKMEAFVPGDYRLSIRGSLLRSPWGIRNVKIYWNDIPLTSPDGSASHAVDMDPSLIGTMEIIKGPAGSIYGAGNGGVLIFKSDKARSGESFIQAGATAGSFGFSRLHTTYKTSTNNFNLVANYVNQRYSGYRENGWSNKQVLNIFSQFFDGPKRTISFLANHAEGSFGISGSVDSAWAANMPRKAVAFSRDNRTSVKKSNFTMLAASQAYRFNDKFSNNSAIYGNFQSLNHPYGQSLSYNGFLKESTQGMGGRTKFTYTPTIGNIKSRFTVGMELQYQYQAGNTYNIINDKPGTWPETGNLQTSDIVVARSNIMFAQGEFDLPSGFLLTLGASYNKLTYDVTDLQAQSATHENYTGSVKFPSAVSPRLALVRTLNQNMAAHVSVSFGFSPPTAWEANNGDGSFNKELKAEKGVNYELGMRGTILNDRFNFDATIYQMNLTDALVPRVNQFGTTSFTNAGSTRQKGFEVSLSFLGISNPNTGVKLLKPWINYTFNHYRFSSFAKESFDWSSGSTVKSDFSGKMITGITPYTLNAGVDLETRAGFYFNATLNNIGKTPINDANTYYQQAYTLLASKLGYKRQISRIEIDISAGANNLLDARYSSLINFNADAVAYGGAPQFYNPSPSRNFYGGIAVRFKFAK